MALNTLYIPHILPLTFRLINSVEQPQYVSKQMDRHFFEDTIQPWQQPVTFLQPFQTSDSIRLQFKSKVGPLYLNVYNCYGARVDQQLFTSKQRDRFNPDTYIYEIIYSLAALQPGTYYFTLGIGSENTEKYRSEPIDLQVRHENSLLIEYGGTGYKNDVYFSTGLVYQLRVHGTYEYEPGSDVVGFTDQPHNVTVINDTTFDVYHFHFGFTKGVPDAYVKKLNKVLGCELLMIDGILYAKGEDSKLEKTTTIERYPLKYYSIDLYPALNRESNIDIGDVPNYTRIVVAANVSTQGFGNDNSDNIITITNVSE